LLKKEKNNFAKFGNLIDPHYSIDQAVKDGAVVPLLYEGRHVEMEPNKAAIDLWFDRHTQGMTDEQRADLKRKYARAEVLNKAEQVVYMRAFDISEHYRATWQGTGFKAQLVAPSRAVALKYQDFLNDIGMVTSEVVMSSPDMREGQEEVDEEPTDSVVVFWKRMMKRFGNEEEYNKQIINQFKFGQEPEILIVVSKLLTGFDAPKNQVIYLCRDLREHTLLQAIARVNRVCEGKDFGYVVDYVGLLGELDKALTMYSAFENYDDEDLAGTLMPVGEEVKKLAQRYSDVWDLFKEVKNRYDEEAYEELLRDVSIRERFYHRLNDFSKTLQLALSTETFLSSASNEDLVRYKHDMRRFQNLKTAVKKRYGEAVDYREHDAKIQKMIDTHLQANEVTQLNEPVNIFDESAFHVVKEEQGVYQTQSTASKADTIAHRCKRVLTERMGEDPAFYEKLSKMIQDAIDAFREKRISDLEYLERSRECEETLRIRRHSDTPKVLEGRADAQAYFGVAKGLLAGVADDVDALAAEVGLKMEALLEGAWKVHFWEDEDAVKLLADELDDYYFDHLMGDLELELSSEQMDALTGKLLEVAEHRRPS
jgi:type I restriction enzyme R subunit